MLADKRWKGNGSSRQASNAVLANVVLSCEVMPQLSVLIVLLGVVMVGGSALGCM